MDDAEILGRSLWKSFGMQSIADMVDPEELREDAERSPTLTVKPTASKKLKAIFKGVDRMILACDHGITTPEEFGKGECPRADMRNGLIMRFHEQIGKASDLTITPRVVEMERS